MSALETFVLFFGYPRSGHSFFGQCINSRSDALISHEFDVIYHLMRNKNMSVDQIYEGISLRNDFFCDVLDYTWEGYKYDICPFEQRYKSNLVCVGDKKGGGLRNY